jgi:hypothetical protein
MLIKALSAAAGNSGGGYSIEDSLRFNDNDSANLSRTPSVAGNLKTWTWSGWVKRGNIGTNQTLFVSNNAGSQQYTAINFNSSDQIYLLTGTTIPSNPHLATSSAVFRDTSGWYHIVSTLDTTQADANLRWRVWVNGSEIVMNRTATATQNLDLNINRTQAHYIGQFGNSATYFDGYMAEINFVDGQALTADDFGEINEDTGEWSPIEYEGTYGTNGFYLPFDGNANDSSGNGNNWTENNLASTDYMISTPTNNFNVFNVIAAAPSSADTYEEGNLEATNSTVDPRTSITTIPVSSGKWYAEFYYQAQTSNAIVFGVVTDSYSPSSSTLMAYLVSSGGGVVGYFGFNGNKYIDGVSTGYGSSFTVGDIIGVALNLDDNEITFYKNNVSQGVITSKTFSGAYNFFTASGTGGGGQRSLLNAGQDSSFAGLKTRQGNTDANGNGDFYYAPPAGGYLALCTDNLPEPTIEQPETQFNVVTYTGDGTSSKSITGVGFQPDLVWIKQRDIAQSHTLTDSVRGAGNILSSNSTAADYTLTTYGQITSFDSDGFTATKGSDPTFSYFNKSGGTYVAWCWKAGGTAVSNTDGSITSQVSANVDAGFSIVSYTGNGTNPSTIGHGLGVVPAMIITKVRSTTGEWPVYHQSLTPDYTLYLNATYAASTYQNRYDYSAFTSSVYSSHATSGGEINTSGQTYIAYCFAEIEGFSKFGSYVGNGSANGTFVYTGTGFKPAFVMIKRTDSTQNWPIVDTSRDTYNIANKRLFANLSNAEDTGIPNYLDLLSNGFKCRDGNVSYNASGGTYIYMAFAEHPFKYATGR